MIGVGGDAGDDLGVAGLHRPRRAPQRHDAARAAKRNVIEPARRQAEMLGQPDCGVRRDGEARYREAVDVRRAESRRAVTSSCSARPIHQCALLVE